MGRTRIKGQGAALFLCLMSLAGASAEDCTCPVYCFMKMQNGSGYIYYHYALQYSPSGQCLLSSPTCLISTNQVNLGSCSSCSADCVRSGVRSLIEPLSPEDFAPTRSEIGQAIQELDVGVRSEKIEAPSLPAPLKADDVPVVLNGLVPPNPQGETAKPYVDVLSPVLAKFKKKGATKHTYINLFSVVGKPKEFFPENLSQHKFEAIIGFEIEAPASGGLDLGSDKEPDKPGEAVYKLDFGGRPATVITTK